jgi:nitrite transporter NirC
VYQVSVIHFAEVARDKSAGLQRSRLGFFVGSMMAGAYIGIAMILALSCAAGLAAGMRPLVLGATFGIGLILTVFAGAELFTGYVMYAGFGLARRTIEWANAVDMLITVWIGNLAGALLLAVIFVAGGGGAVFADGGIYLNAYVAHKLEADAVALLARAALCNWLVCLAIWSAARVTGDAAKCIVLAWTLLAFVAAGFEHSVANMTALALGLLAPHTAATLLTVIRNLVIVTAGNVLGGAVFVVFGYLAAAGTDSEGEARHDAGELPKSLRTTPANSLSDQRR